MTQSQKLIRAKLSLLELGKLLNNVSEACRVSERKARPGIFNTDQGSQFTSEPFTSTLLRRDIRISMDGRGRPC